MNEEKQTGNEIVLAGNPYREAGMAPVDRKLPKDIGNSLVDIIIKDNHSADSKFQFGCEKEGTYCAIDVILEKLGYEQYSKGLFIKGSDFYMVSPLADSKDKISLVSGRYSGNIETLIESSETFTKLAINNPPYLTQYVACTGFALGLAGAITVKFFGADFMICMKMFVDIGLLGTPFGVIPYGVSRYLKLRKKRKLARDLPADFSNYIYGNYACEKLKKEYQQFLEQKTRVELPKNEEAEVMRLPLGMEKQ